MKKQKGKGGIAPEDALLWEKVAKTVRPYQRKQALKEKPVVPETKSRSAAKSTGALKAPATPRAKDPATPRAKDIAIPRAKDIAIPRTKDIAIPRTKDIAIPRTKDIDRSTKTKLSRGQMPVEGVLDLHGMTQQQAFAALERFVTRCREEGRRNLLIITGKGDRTRNTGVLRRMLPLWLETGALGSGVLAVSQAKPKDGGEGAFYVRLRKS